MKRSLKIAAILLAFISQASAQNLSHFHNLTTEVDGISVTLRAEEGIFIAVLDKKVGRNRSVRIEQGLRAIMDATGCHASYQSGTIFDFQGSTERPTFIPANVSC